MAPFQCLLFSVVFSFGTRYLLKIFAIVSSIYSEPDFSPWRPFLENFALDFDEFQSLLFDHDAKCNSIQSRIFSPYLSDWNFIRLLTLIDALFKRAGLVIQSNASRSERSGMIRFRQSPESHTQRIRCWITPRFRCLLTPMRESKSSS